MSPYSHTLCVVSVVHKAQLTRFHSGGHETAGNFCVCLLDALPPFRIPWNSERASHLQGENQVCVCVHKLVMFLFLLIEKTDS